MGDSVSTITVGIGVGVGDGVGKAVGLASGKGVSVGTGFTVDGTRVGVEFGVRGVAVNMIVTGVAVGDTRVDVLVGVDVGGINASPAMLEVNVSLENDREDSNTKPTPVISNKNKPARKSVRLPIYPPLPVKVNFGKLTYHEPFGSQCIQHSGGYRNSYFAFVLSLLHYPSAAKY